MTELTISMPPALQSWIDDRLAGGDYADVEEYVCDLVRRDQDAYRADVQRVRALIKEGVDSGVVDAEPEDVLDEIIADIRTRHG